MKQFIQIEGFFTGEQRNHRIADDGCQNGEGGHMQSVHRVSCDGEVGNELLQNNAGHRQAAAG